MDWNRRAAVFLAFAGSAVAQVEGKLDLNQLIREALERNPEVLAAQKKYEAARQRPAQEGALPDPMFSAGWNSSGNPLPGFGLGTEPVANIGAMLSQPLPAPGGVGEVGGDDRVELGVQQLVVGTDDINERPRRRGARWRDGSNRCCRPGSAAPPARA